jgi:hypothetical protein
MRLDDLARRIEAAADVLASRSATITLVDPGPQAFGADATGRLGDLGRALHRRFSTALGARSREAAAHGARLAETAQALRLIARNYREIEDDRRDRHDGVGA